MIRRPLHPNSPASELTVREHFACQIVASLVTSAKPGGPSAWAEAAVWYADALIKELNAEAIPHETPASDPAAEAQDQYGNGG